MDKIIIIGAGLSGTLLAIRMAQRGFEVELYERRPDLRTSDISAGRSINLALSDRGLSALRMIGIEEEVLKEVIPMYGRMIHPEQGGNLKMLKYSGREDEWINSVSRGGLNGILLDKAEEYPNILLAFNTKCTAINYNLAEATLFDAVKNKSFTSRGAVVIGTDGAGSVVRRSLLAHGASLRFNFQQKFLEHGYKELSILPNETGGFRLEKNVLHIWPRGTYMLIALPNLDGSFTVTLFLPFEGKNGFNNLNTKEKVIAFFQAHFPDALGQMPHLAEEFFENPTGTLGTIKCYPWQVKGKVLLLGDAAHAIVPFYGQGMNAAFEDCVIFDVCVEEYGNDWAKVLTTYQESRKEDADAIADLAEENFFEMRDHVANPVFVKKRKLEMQLEQQFPDYFSKYSMVTFQEDLPYSEAMKKGRQQDDLLMKLCKDTADVNDLDLNEVYQKMKDL